MYYGADDDFFLFFIFSNHVFWRQFKGQKVGGGKGFSNRCTLGWTIIFFDFFQKKSSLCTMGKIHFFWKLDFQWGGRSFFCFFWRKKMSPYTMGKIHFLSVYAIWLPHGNKHWAYTRLDYLKETNIPIFQEWYSLDARWFCKWYLRS